MTLHDRTEADTDQLYPTASRFCRLEFISSSSVLRTKKKVMTLLTKSERFDLITKSERFKPLGLRRYLIGHVTQTFQLGLPWESLIGYSECTDKAA